MISRLLIALSALSAASAETEPPPSAVLVRRCRLEYERSTAVGASVWGVLQERLVEPGDRVKAGQSLGKLQDEDLKVESEVRTAEAANDVEVRLYDAKRDRAAARLKGSEKLWKRNLLSADEYASHRFEAETAALEAEQAKYRRRLAGVQLRHVEASIRARALISPHAGIVSAALKRPGEAVAPGEVVFRVVDDGRLRVSGRVDVVDSWRVRDGQSVRVRVDVAGSDLPVERETFDGVLVFVDRQIDPLNRTSEVVARVENRDDLLRPGLDARMEIHVDD